MYPNIPFINQIPNLINNEQNINYDKLLNKIERLEKNLRIIENRLNILENKDNKPKIINEPTDMYMI